MAPKIFITGVTGYIGGDTLYALNEKHPDYEISALIRSQDKADTVKKSYPKLREVIGGLDDSDLITEEAAKADIVIHTADASDHEGAAKAIAAGIKAGHYKEHPGYWLHTGGTGILTWEDTKLDRLGEHDDREYNDWTRVDELTNLPDDAFHRNVDKIVIEAGTSNPESTKSIIVCPPTIYGEGRGPVNVRSRQVYELTKFILNNKYVPMTGNGKARWNHVHVADLADAFVLLTEAAVAGNTDPELWGAKGYVIIEHGEHVWSDVAKAIGAKATELGYLDKEPETKSLSKQEALDVAGFEAVSWGLNSRAKGERLSKVLGWKPSRPDLFETITEIVKQEHADMTKSK